MLVIYRVKSEILPCWTRTDWLHACLGGFQKTNKWLGRRKDWRWVFCRTPCCI